MIFVFAVNIVICLWLRISLAEIAFAHLYLASSYVVGKAVIRWFGAEVSKDYAVVGSTIVGAVAYTIYAAIIFHITNHGVVLAWLFFVAIWLPVLISVAISIHRAEKSMRGMFAGDSERGHPPPSWLKSLAQVVIDPLSPFKSEGPRRSRKDRVDWDRFGIAALSLIITVSTFYGFVHVDSRSYQKALHTAEESQLEPAWLRGWDANTQISIWGSQDDKGSHLVSSVNDVVNMGFPHANFMRRGVQLLAMPPALGFYLYDSDRYVRMFKVLAFYIWFALLFSCYQIGKDWFDISGVYLRVLVVASVLYGAIVYPFFELTRSTYLGFAKPTLGCFHNLTQLTSLVVGSAGLYFVYGYLRNRTAGLNLGMALIAMSVFYKPSFFTIAAPAFTIVIVVGVLRRQLSVKALGSVAILFLVPISWKLYGTLIEAPPYSLSTSFMPFELYFGRAAWRFPDWVTTNPVVFATVILLLSFCFPLLVSLGNLKNWKAAIASPIVQAMLLMFVIGTISSFVLVENNQRMTHGNFGWGGQAAYFIIFPLVFYGFQTLRSNWLRWLCWFALLLHIAAGIQHLLHYLIAGQLA